MCICLNTDSHLLTCVSIYPSNLFIHLSINLSISYSAQTDLCTSKAMTSTFTSSSHPSLGSLATKWRCLGAERQPSCWTSWCWSYGSIRQGPLPAATRKTTTCHLVPKSWPRSMQNLGECSLICSLIAGSMHCSTTEFHFAMSPDCCWRNPRPKQAQTARGGTQW